MMKEEKARSVLIPGSAAAPIAEADVTPAVRPSPAAVEV
jgi:hypothetical protein